MGCGGSKSVGVEAKKPEGKEEDYLREPENDPEGLEDVLGGYPPPKPSPNKKEHIFTDRDKSAADARATQISVEDYQSLGDLARALTHGLNDVQKVRTIFTWIGLQGRVGNIPKSKKNDGNNNTEDVTSPQIIVQKVLQRQFSYNFLFVSLCRAAHIPCVLIRGLGKSVAYEVGDQDIDSLNNSWTAVYVSGGWHFVFPLWAFSAVVGHSTGTWTLVETQGKGAREKEDKSSGRTISRINDYFFFTEPEEFIYCCFPYDYKWQLLLRPFTKQDFIDISYCKEGFFKNRYRITTPAKCLYTSAGGVCDIEIKKPNKEDCVHTYKLYFNHGQSKTTLPSEIQLERYVAVFNEGLSVRFHIRFPSEGVYKMTIFGGRSLLCEFRLDCNEAVSNVKPFPCHPESGFGPNAVTEESGLLAQSHKTGFISMKSTKNFNIKFHVQRNVLIQTILVHNTVEEETLNKHVNHKMKGQELDINVNLPQQGEYVLQINTKDKESGDSYKNACNYLLTSENMNKKRKPYENALEKKVRKMLQECSLSKDLEALQKALDEFDKTDLEDKGDRQKAVERIHFLSLRKELKDAIARRHGEKLEEAIQKAKSSEFESSLQSLIKEAEELLSQLRRLRRFAHEILEMQPSTISEIHSYKYPKPLAYDIMKATYTLLGEQGKHVEEWEQLQALMRKKGKQGLLLRVRQFDIVHVTENMINHASQLLQPYDEERVRNSSAGLGTFYKWTTDVTDEATKSEDSLTESVVPENMAKTQNK